MKIVLATDSDYAYIRKQDHPIFVDIILNKIRGNEIYIIRNPEDCNIGWIRYDAGE
ncbi:hypothetical protein D3C84_1292440 [compost metagenome]